MRAAIVQFQPQLKTNKNDRKPVRSINGPKYYTPQQIQALRRHARRQAEYRKTWKAEKQWLLIDLATKTGLRLFEICNLRVGDLHLNYGEASIYVRDGKCSLSGTVIIDECLERHLKHFLKHKEQKGELTGDDDYLFCSQRQECWSSQAVQHIVK
jgi:site-specific recombinase XerD